ncbi:MAG TPA: FxLYD domain-containing protein [Candidatus Binataceae bacterium]|nr:FxLYD domain-containing protein [Candidatus Binataceae bacterium]
MPLQQAAVVIGSRPDIASRERRAARAPAADRAGTRARGAAQSVAKMRKSTLLILLGAGAFAAWVFYSLSRVEPVRVVRSTIQHRGGRVFVEGELSNGGPDVGSLEVEVRYYDRSGREVGEDKFALGGLKNGAHASFRGPERDLEGVAGYSLYLNHGRNPYGN